MRIFLITLILLFSASEASTIQLLPTKLRITVLNDLGNNEVGASVSIYTKKEDYLSSSNPLQTAKTDEKGRVTFKDLKPVAYYVEVRKGEMNNDAAGSMIGKLAEGRINKVNVVIQ